MKTAVLFALSLSLIAGPALAGEGEAEEIAAARSFALAALPGQCDAEMPGSDYDFTDTAIAVSWKPSWGGEDERATLYRLFCMLGAYNVVHAYVLKPENGEFSLVSFAQPSFDIDYVEGDEMYTELKGPPVVTGFLTAATLVNSDFDADTNTLSSSAKWRGLGDAWSAGTWQLRDGQFVLASYVIDPIYEANLDDPSDALADTYFEIYP
jgi:hypothetical protein